MSTLRVLLNNAPSPVRDDAWTLFDDDERLVREGRGTPASWPQADRREAILSASAVRVIALRLPPMSAERIPAAAAFALEDQLAGPAHEQHLALVAQPGNGIVLMAVADRRLMAALRADFVRVLAEPAIAPTPSSTHWRWYTSAADGAFVRRADGSAFATTEPGVTLPPELSFTLAHAARAGAAPSTVEVAFAAEPEQLAAWSVEGDVKFARAAPWVWHHAGRALRTAPDLLQGEFSREARVHRRGIAAYFRWAMGIAAAALVLHVGATAVQWTGLRIAQWRTAQAIIAMATATGLAPVDDPATAAGAVARAFTDARHRAGLAAPADAIPMLARAAPAVAALPGGTLKSASYTTGQWTLELAKLDADTLSRLERRLRDHGLASIAAATGSGTRMRVTLMPGADAP